MNMLVRSSAGQLVIDKLRLDTKQMVVLFTLSIICTGLESNVVNVCNIKENTETVHPVFGLIMEAGDGK